MFQQWLKCAQKTLEQFKKLKTLDWNKRDAPYPRVRVSYHKGQNKFEDIITELNKKNIIEFKNNEYNLELTFDEIKESLLGIINNEPEGISYGRIISKLISKYKILSLLPHYDLIGESLKKFVESGITKVEALFGSSSPTGNAYFSATNYQKDQISLQYLQALS